MEYAAEITVWFDAESDAAATRLADELTDLLTPHDAVRGVATGLAEPTGKDA